MNLVATPITALVVDDSRVTAELLKHMLGKLDISVTVSPTAKEGLAAAAQEAYAIVFLDMQLPDATGLEVARALRKTGFTAPIIGMSAETAEVYEDDCTEAGCDQFLLKPFTMQRLDQLLTELEVR